MTKGSKEPVGLAPMVEPPDLWVLLSFSVRYAMGRMSTAPSLISSLVVKFSSWLPTHQLEQIREEVQDELDLSRSTGTFLGMECDHREWQQLVEQLDRTIGERESISNPRTKTRPSMPVQE